MCVSSWYVLLVLLVSVCTVQAEDSANRICVVGKWKCLTSDQCISLSWRCDSDRDCQDGSDEENCPPATCAADSYNCRDTTSCISKRWLCDGEDDCVHGDDESLNLCKSNYTCNEEQFSCDNSTCIPRYNVCNGNTDCLDSSDEMNCTRQCEIGSIACNDGQCISSNWQCDGVVDCLDGSDEQECEPKVCNTDQFKCTDTKRCIDVKWVCDGDIDCDDKSDENNCTSSSNKHVTCDQTGWQCRISTECIHKSWLCDGDLDCEDGTDEGEYLLSDATGKSYRVMIIKKPSLGIGISNAWKKRLHRIPIYYCKYNCSEELFLCNGHCINKGLLCDGNTDCFDGSDEKNCATERPVMLYYANRRDIRRLRTDTRATEVLIIETQNSVALDFDYEDSLIFWTDSGAEKIMRAREDKETGMVTDIIDVVEGNGKEPFSVDGIAVDWLYKNIYWTDTGSNKIKVSNYDGSKSKTLIDSGLDEPRAICVDPENGYMYWSDWGSDAKIERSGMDGIGREIIVYGEKYLMWPNGLTIDYVGKRIYWIDSKLQKIGTANLDGSNTTLMDVDGILRPFSISVFEDSLYWTDWQDGSIKTANKITGKDVKTLLLDIYAVMDVKVYHGLRQNRKFKDQANKLCEAAQCEFLCLPTARHSDTATVTCVCGDEKKLSYDNKTCSIAQDVITTTLEPSTSSFAATATTNMSSKPVTRERSTWHAYTSTIIANTPTMTSKQITGESSTRRVSSTFTVTTNIPITMSSKPVTTESPPTTSLSPIVTTESVDTIQPRTSPPCQNESTKATVSSRDELQQSKLEKTRLSKRRIQLVIKILTEKRGHLRAMFEQRLAHERRLTEAKITLINHKIENQKKKLGTGET